MLPPSSDPFSSSGENLGDVLWHEPQYLESSLCARPQMAWEMYEQLLRIAKNREQQQRQPRSKDDELHAKRVWLAAFTGHNLAYGPGVVAGAAEPL